MTYDTPRKNTCLIALRQTLSKVAGPRLRRMRVFARPLDPALDPAEDALHEHGLRAGEAAPDPTQERGHVEEREAEPGQQEEHQVEVLVA